jgi:NADH dehydrogenase [ubiquinone] 1 alpha subcomplex assembly factor 5
MDSAAAPFDRRAVRAHRDRAAAGFGAHAFLKREAAVRLADRLDDIQRTFPRALDLGCHGGELGKALTGHGGIEWIVSADPSPAMAAAARAREPARAAVAAEEELLPFAPGVFDAVVSALSLHWVNDLPGTLVQIRRTLKPGGLLLVAMLGGETLRELRAAFHNAEQERGGGVSPRVSPFVDVRDAGDLLARAGLVQPVTDVDTVTVSYKDPLRLMTELRGMGESNAVRGRRRGFTGRGTLLGAVDAYSGAHAGPDGRVPATFQIVTLTAWAPGELARPAPGA